MTNRVVALERELDGLRKQVPSLGELENSFGKGRMGLLACDTRVGGEEKCHAVLTSQEQLRDYADLWTLFQSSKVVLDSQAIQDAPGHGGRVGKVAVEVGRAAAAAQAEHDAVAELLRTYAALIHAIDAQLSDMDARVASLERGVS
eukprot:CAMPEP_0119120168 /NCGR_PEP_ID=MMETSP1310-20130426/1319_1 /TAXON_ID=464262 /ORGANISM="Genus nov. species nov., Strain RCC2339" /LENGTH=145 /DNA_ID=CAMNT_0007109635 /DNA_START=230 /DNA_END=667 /DNA_ORIENTATION=+